MSTVLATGATKKEYVSELASENASQIELKGIIKSVFKDFASKKQTLQKRQFYRLKHTSGTSWDQQFPLKTRFGTRRETLSKKRLTKERNKTLAGSTLGGNGLKMCSNRLPIGLPSRFIFCTVLNFPSAGLLVTAERHE